MTLGKSFTMRLPNYSSKSVLITRCLISLLFFLTAYVARAERELTSAELTDLVNKIREKVLRQAPQASEGSYIIYEGPFTINGDRIMVRRTKVIDIANESENSVNIVDAMIDRPNKSVQGTISGVSTEGVRLGITYSGKSVSAPPMVVPQVGPSSVTSMTYTLPFSSRGPIADLLPEIAFVAFDAVQQVQNATQMSKILREAREASFNQGVAFGKMLEAQTEAIKQESNLKIVQGMITEGANLGSMPVFDLKQDELIKNVRIQEQNPLLEKRYEIRGKEKDKLREELSVAIQEKNAVELAELAPLALNHPKAEPTTEWDPILKGTVVDGIIQAGILTNQTNVSPLDGRQLATPTTTVGGVALRDTLNRAQVIWINKEGFVDSDPRESAAFLAGISLTASADDYFSSGMETKGFSFLKAARGMFNFSAHFTTRILHNLKETIDGLVELGPHLKNFVAALIDDPTGTATNLGSALKNLMHNSLAYQVRLGALFLTSLPGYSSVEASGKRGDAAADIVFNFMPGEVALGIGNITSKILARGGKYASEFGVATNAVKILDSLGPDVLEGGQALPKNAESIAKVFTPSRLKYLRKLAVEKPEVVNDVLVQINVAHERGLPDAVDFLAGSVVAESPILFRAGDAKFVFEKYESLSQKAKLLTPESRVVEVERGALKKIEFENGKSIINTPDKILDFHEGMTQADGRLCRGGREGVPGMCGVIVEAGIDTHVNIAKELRVTEGSEIVYGRKEFSIGKVMDLTNQTVQEKLGLTTDLLTIPIEQDQYAYRLPQIIGDIAYKLGYDAVIYPSRFIGKNIVIFKR